jgi:serine/threonine protein kinase/signal transduction histidine kinase
VESVKHFEIQQVLCNDSKKLVYRSHSDQYGLSIVRALNLENTSSKNKRSALTQKLKHERDILNRLDHPNVVKVLDFIDDVEKPALILSDISGESLEQYCLAFKDNLLPIDQFFTIAFQLLDALEHLHISNVVHRDLHPGNIVVNDTTLHTQLIDFELAVTLEPGQLFLKPFERLEGHLGYMSPEQTGRVSWNIDHRSDFYSLGATFFFMLTGRTVFPDQDALSLVHAHLAKTPPLTGEMRPELVIELQQLIKKLLSKSPDDRYKSVAGIRHDLTLCQRRQKNPAVAAFALGQEDHPIRLTFSEFLYGRDQALTLLEQCIEELQKTALTSVVLTGLSGTGKSSVVAQASQKAGSDYQFIQTKAHTQQENIPYSLIRQLMNSWLGQMLTKPDDEIARFRDALIDALGGSISVLIKFEPQLAEILGDHHDLPTVLAPQETQVRLHNAVLSFLKVAAEQSPVLVFLDDLQWADRASLEMLAICGELQSSRVLFVFSYRSNEVPKGHLLLSVLQEFERTAQRYEFIQLDSFSHEQVTAWLEDLFQPNRFDLERLATSLLAKTNGNPLFIKELISRLYREEIIRYCAKENAWLCDYEQVASSLISDSVVDLVLQKLEQMSDEVRLTLAQAACIGGEFNQTLLLEISQTPDVEVQRHLDQAVEWGILNYINGSFFFTHDRMLEAAYYSVDSLFRSELHSRIGLALYDQHQGLDDAAVPEESLFVAIEHLSHSHRLLLKRDSEFLIELIKYYRLASRKSLAVGAWNFSDSTAEIANSFLDEVITRDGFTDTYSRLRFGLTRIRALNNFILGHHGQAEHYYQYLFDQLDNQHSFLEICIERLIQFMGLGRWQEAYAMGTQGLDVLEFTLDSDPNKPFVELINRQEEETLRFLITNYASLTRDNERHYLLVELLASIGQCAIGMADMSLAKQAFSAALKNACDYRVGENLELILTCASNLLARESCWDLSKDYARMALEILAKSQSSHQANAYNMLAATILPYFYPYRECLKYHQKGLQASIQTGEQIRAVMNSSNRLFHTYAMGKPIFQVEQDVDQAEMLCKSRKVFFPVYLSYQLIIEGLTEQSFSFQKVRFKHHLDKLIGTIHNTHINHAITQVAFWRKDFTTLAEKLDVHPLATNPGFVFQVDDLTTICVLYLFHRLSQKGYLTLDEFPQALADKLTTEVYDTSLSKLSEFCALNEENHANKLALVNALASWLDDDSVGVVVGKFQQAIDLSREQGFLQYDAVANELLAEYWLHSSLLDYAALHIRKAHALYQHWGASYLSRKIEQKFPQWIYSETTHPDILSVKSSPSSGLDSAANFSLVSSQHNASLASGNVASDGRSAAVSAANSVLSNSYQPSVSGSLLTSEAAVRNSDSKFSDVIDTASLVKALQTISGEINHTALISNVVRIVIENAGAQYGALVLKQGDDFLVEASCEVDKLSISTHHERLDLFKKIPQGIIRYVIRSKQHLLISNVLNDRQHADDPYILDAKPKSLMAIPFFYRKALVGVFYLHNTLTENAFTADRVTTVKTLLNQLSISLENSRLFNQVSDLNSSLEHKVSQRTQELEETQQQLLEAEKMASLVTLVSGMAHEMNTPIGVMLTAATSNKEMLDVLKQTFSTGAMSKRTLTEFLNTSQEGLEMILEGIERSSELISSFKKLSVLTEERRIQRFNVSDLLEGIHVTNSVRWNQHLVDLHLSCEASEQLISYPQAITEVLTLLIDNAMDHAFPESFLEQAKVPPMVSVSYQSTDTTALFVVADNGKGMSKSDQNAMFDPFHTSKRGSGHIGLGGSVIYNLVNHQLSGSIQCSSEIHQGCQFIIEIPKK